MIDPGRCRLLRHAPAEGAWNMAVDEMLLDRAGEQAAACLRLYGWNEPTLSLGYFQNYADRTQHAASGQCAAVRRLTGGGAILHDNELTYSIVLPGRHPLAARRDELYQALHGCLIEALGHFGLAARLCGGHGKGDSPHLCEAPSGPFRQMGTVPFSMPGPFLCFLRRSPGDVLLGQDKICGSAQRRRNQAVLQHGSLLWKRSPAAPELPGVDDLACRSLALDDLAAIWLDGLARRLGWQWQADELDENEVRQARNLAESRYVGEVWTKKLL